MVTFDPGQRLLDRYRIEGFLERGGMGDVYVGRHEALGHRVAVKILHTDEVEYHLRFERESRLMARVQHPNVVSVIDVGRHEDRPFIVMNHVDGEALDHIIDQRRALPWPEAIEIGAALFEGLAAIHAASIVHRDVKPANLLIGPPPLPTVTLIDFSIALDDVPNDPRHTARGVVIGTPDYMAPEQLLGDPVDARTDIYAAGVCLFEMIAGSLPYEDVDRGGVSSMLQRVRQEAPRLTVPGGLQHPPPELVELVADCLAIDPGLRPSDATALAVQLRGLSPMRISGSYVAIGVPSVDDPIPPGSASADAALLDTMSDTDTDIVIPLDVPVATPNRRSTAPAGLAAAASERGERSPPPTPPTAPPAGGPRSTDSQPRLRAAYTPLSVRVSREVGAVEPPPATTDGMPSFRLRAALGVRFSRGTLADPLNAQLLGRLVGRRGHSIVADGDVWVALLRSPSRGDAIRRIAHLQRFVNRRFPDAESVRWTELPDACTNETLLACLGQLLEPLRAPS